MEMGCGKSKVLIDNIVWLYEQGRIDTAVIVAPKGVYRNWETSEIPVHFPTDIPHEVYVWNPSPNKSQAERLKSAFKSVVSSASFWQTWKGSQLKSYPHLWVSSHKAGNFLLAVDESTTIKNPKAKRTKNAGRLRFEGCIQTNPHRIPCHQIPDGPLRPVWIHGQAASRIRLVLLVPRTIRRHQDTAHGIALAFLQIVGYRNLEELSKKLDIFRIGSPRKRH